MSRTDIHRPYWVQASERGTIEYHRHELLGQPKTVYKKKRDERGRIVMVEQPVKIPLRLAAVMYPGELLKPSWATQAQYRVLRTEARRRLDEGERPWAMIDGLETRPQPIWEVHVIGQYVDYCTIDEPMGRDDRIPGTSDQYGACYRRLDYGIAPEAEGRPRGSRGYGYYRDWRRPTRRKAENSTRQLTLLADNGNDMDDDDILEALAR